MASRGLPSDYKRRSRGTDLRLFVFYLSHGLVLVCDIELSDMGKTTAIPIWCALAFKFLLSGIWPETVHLYLTI